MPERTGFSAYDAARRTVLARGYPPVSYLRIIEIGASPKNPAGKILRGRLREIAPS